MKLTDLAAAVDREMAAQDAGAATGDAVLKGDGYKLVVQNMTSTAFDIVKQRAKESEWLEGGERPRRLNIGLGQANVLCQMKYAERLAFIAEGLPLILDSARDLWAAGRQLVDAPRSANVLEGHAEEEAAKILILMDIVRCPPNLVSSRAGTMVKWFYDHLARLIYAKAVSWRATDVAYLREAVDRSRQAHYVEGNYGEYIMPNDEIYGRESRLYVDIEVQEDDHIPWSVPRGYQGPRFFDDTPVLRLANAMLALGMFSPAGLRATSEVWGKADFTNERTGCESDALIWELLERLDREKLFTEAAEDKHVSTLRGHWQLPMYHIDFSMVTVPLDELQRERDRLLWREIGDVPY